MLATRGGFAKLDESGRFELIVEVEADIPVNRMNDGKCDHYGRFWAGTMSEDDEPGAGSVYRLERDGSVTKVFGGSTVSNGLDWSPDGTVMYYVDSLTYGIDAFDFDGPTGEPSARRRLVDIPREKGLADGVTVDKEGFIWVALHSGGGLERYSPQGVLDIRVDLPVSLVTNCAFGGPDLTDLYITTAVSRDLEEELAGALFLYRPGVAGLLTHSYRG